MKPPDGVNTSPTEQELEDTAVTDPHLGQHLHKRAKEERARTGCPWIHCMNECGAWAIEGSFFCSKRCRDHYTQ